MAGETIISITYGLDIEPVNDYYLETAEKGVRTLLEAGIPGTFLVDSLPLLKYVPEWIPGAGFQRKGRESKMLAQAMVNEPYRALLSKMVSVAHNLSNIIS